MIQQHFSQYFDISSNLDLGTYIFFQDFPQTKEEVPNFFGEQILQSGWIIWSSLYLSFKNLKDQNSLLFIRFQCILYDSAGTFLSIFKFSQMKQMK